MMESKSNLMTEQIVLQVLHRIEGSLMGKRLEKIEEQLDSTAEQVETAVLEKVAEMLTDNIYDIIPGYAELEESVQILQGELGEAQEETSRCHGLV